MPRAIKSAALSFGMVNVPVKLYKAVDEVKTKMHLHHAKDGGKIRQKKWCEACKAEVTQDEIVKGVELDGQVVTLTPDELKQIRPEKSAAIKIVEFVPAKQIETLLFDSCYYLGVASPKDNGAFFLLREALRQCGKVAIGTMTMREREYACAIEPYQSGFVLTTLHYAEEVRDIDELAVKEPVLNEEELKAARQLIEMKSVDVLDMTQFEDSFASELQNLIATKARGETFTVEQPEPVVSGMNFVEALKAMEAEA